MSEIGFVELEPSPEQFAASLAVSPTASKTRRQRLRKIHTPFNEVTKRFAAVIIRRLRLEKECELNNHQREMELLRLESRRLDLEEKRIEMLNQLESVLEKLSEILTQLRLLPDTR